MPEGKTTLTLRQWELLNAVSLNAAGIAEAPELGVLIAHGFVRRDPRGPVTTTPAGEAYLREEMEAAIRESASWLTAPHGPEHT
jgi:hypothetical protein